MRRRRKRYYHKTIVLRGMCVRMTMLFLAVLVFVGMSTSAAMQFGFKPDKAYILKEFKEFFQKGQGDFFVKPTTYEHILSVIPSIKSSEEMTKKYAARYQGVKKESTDNRQDESGDDGNHENLRIQSMDMSAKGISFRNETSYVPDLNALLNTKLSFRTTSGTPGVLIMHTHTSEAYAESPQARSTDNAKNVVRIGAVLQEQLEVQGIGVVHDVSRNDYPAYNGSYTKALSCIQSNLEKHPQIEVVLDVHRDYAEQTKNDERIQLKPVTEVDGKPVAQIMFVIGTDSMGLNHPDWKRNLAFAVQIQTELNKISPKIARPINIRRERFNQHMTKGSVIIEMGTAGNTLTECENAAIHLGQAIAAVIKNNKKG